VLARAFAVQGSWNYETLTGTGFAFVILPALRELYPDPESLDRAIRRHEGPFNSHPYLAPLALGAVIRMERDGEDPAVIERFKAALRGSLGTLGDRLVWAGWRPVCVLLALALLLAGLPWWAVILTFLLVYNAVHMALMTWGLYVGLNEGRRVAERLRSSAVRSTQPRVMDLGAFATGVVIVMVLARGVPGVGGPPGWAWALAGVVAAAMGARWGEQARRGAAVVVAVLAVTGLALGLLAGGVA
jgi:PTS system mannose-specific IID component